MGIPPKDIFGCFNRLKLVIGGIDVLPECFNAVDAVLHLPAPVVPFRMARALPGRRYGVACCHGFVKRVGGELLKAIPFK